MLNGISKYLTKFIKKYSSILKYLAIFLSYIYFSLLFFIFIHNYSVNILYWDQWDRLNEILISKDYKQILLYQQNEHRIGVGLIIMRVISTFSNLNNITEMFISGILISLSCLLAIILKIKLSRKIEILDILIPTIFFNLYQWENLLWGFQLVFILQIFYFFTSIYLFLFIKSKYKNIMIIFISLIATYTSLPGLILNFVLILFYLFYFFKDYHKKKYLIPVFLLLIISISYFIGYKQPSHLDYIDNIKIPLSNYVKYIMIQINSFIGLRYHNIFSFFLTPIIFSLFFLLTIKNIIIKRNLTNFIILILLLYSFIFSVLTSYGRTLLGIDQAYSSRYATFMIPLYYGLYIFLSTYFKKNIFIFFKIVLLFLFMINYLNNNLNNYNEAYSRYKNLSNWKECYLEFKKVELCNNKINFKIYPHSNSIYFINKLKYIEKNKLNLFSK